MNVQELFRSTHAITPSGRVADQVHQLMLAAIIDGHLTSGQSIQDHVWADELGVSRTPIREATQRLHALGLLDVAPARFTRLRSFAPDTAHQEARDWAVLHRAVISSVIPTVTTELMDRLDRTRHNYQQHLTDGLGRYAANFAFHQALRDATPAFALRLGANAAAYRFRLAEPHLPQHPETITLLHTGIIAALDNGTPEAAHHAIDSWTHTLTHEHALAA